MVAQSIGSDAKITITSASDVQTHFDELYDDLCTPETEHTWQKIECAISHIHAITRGGATKHVEFITLLKNAADPINNALLSERTKLSGTAGDLLNSIAPRMAQRFEPLVPVFVPTLLLICARTNKVAVKRAERSLHFIVRHCKPPSVVSYLKDAISDKSQGLRAVTAGTLVLVLENTDKDRLARRVIDIEACIKSGATDSNPEVRQTTKRIFELYVSIWPERVEHFTKPMTPTIRRYLSLPKTGALQVDVAHLTEQARPASHASKAPTSAHSTRHEQAHISVHAPQPPPASAYNFFPDLARSTTAASSTSACTSKPPAFSMNDASYGKRGLFAEQIAAARNARFARMPSFKFDDTTKPTDTACAAAAIKRQPSLEQLRTQAAASGAFRVPRFDVVVAPSSQDSTDARPRSAHNEASAYRDINASAPSFGAASGLQGKSVLLAAHKQASVVEVASANSTASRDRLPRDTSENPWKHMDKRREKTVTVRFEPEPPHDEARRSAIHVDMRAEQMHRSKSAPQIAVQDSTTRTDTARTKTSKTEPVECAVSDSHSDSDEVQRPRTPPERILHAQTPRTGVKASRVRAQRVAVPSAVKVSAMRVAVPTPSAKVAATRMRNPATSVSVESSPVPKAPNTSAYPRTPRAQTTNAEPAMLPTTAEHVRGEAAAKTTDQADKMEIEQNEMQEEHKIAATEKKTEAKDKAWTAVAAVVAVDKPASSAGQSCKAIGKPLAARAATSASLTAKPRVQAKAASRCVPIATGAAANKAVKRAAVAVRPTPVSKPLICTTSASKAPAKPAVPTATSVKANKRVTKPCSTATSSAMARAKIDTNSKPVGSTAAAGAAAPAKTPSANKQNDTISAARTSTLTASTASTRNKMVHPVAKSTLQSKPSGSSTKPSTTRMQSRPKSSIAASITAKSKLVRARAARSDKPSAVKKAGALMAAKIVKHQRASAAAVARVELARTLDEAMADEAVFDAREDNEEQAEATRVSEAEVEAEQQAAQVGAPAAVSEVETVGETRCVSETPERTETRSEEHTTGGTVDMHVSTCQTQISPDGEPASMVEERRSDHPSEAAVSPVSISSTRVKTAAPSLADTTPRVKMRTPLSSKDANILTPECIAKVDKVASARATPLKPSALRRSKVLVRVRVEPESSFDATESESEHETPDEVVQLQFRPHHQLHAAAAAAADRS